MWAVLTISRTSRQVETGQDRKRGAGGTRARRPVGEGAMVCDVTEPLDYALPASTEAPTFAREVVGRNLCPEHATAAELPALMLVSELVAYAVVYGSPPFRLRLTCEVRLLRIAVEAGSLPLDAGRPGAVDETGLRDRIIHKVARTWGIDRGEDHDTYWCTLPTGYLPHQREAGVPEQMPLDPGRSRGNGGAWS